MRKLVNNNNIISIFTEPECAKTILEPPQSEQGATQKDAYGCAIRESL
jgi:hypothetical protein